eukprot:1161187-Pelagomonas_calceolata.AAC.13
MARAGTCLGGCASEAGNGGPLRVYEWPTVALPCVCTTQVIGTGVNAINHGEIKSVGELQAAAFGPTGKVPFADVKGNEGRIQGTLLSREAVPAFMHDQACPSGEAALEFIEKAPSLPDMVLLDVTLPGMSGFEVRRSSP